jgi:hypothetical protein
MRVPEDAAVSFALQQDLFPPAARQARESIAEEAFAKLALAIYTYPGFYPVNRRAIMCFASGERRKKW